MPTIEDRIQKVIDAVMEQKNAPNPRARALVLTKLDEAMMWVSKMYEDQNPA